MTAILTLTLPPKRKTFRLRARSAYAESLPVSTAIRKPLRLSSSRPTPCATIGSVGAADKTQDKLLVIGAPPAERADAARNRRKILAAAPPVLARDGGDSLALDVVAREAGVGVGTVYRRFGSRAGLVSALL